MKHFSHRMETLVWAQMVGFPSDTAWLVAQTSSEGQAEHAFLHPDRRWRYVLSTHWIGLSTFIHNMEVYKAQTEYAHPEKKWAGFSNFDLRAEGCINYRWRQWFWLWFQNTFKTYLFIGDFHLNSLLLEFFYFRRRLSVPLHMAGQEPLDMRLRRTRETLVWESAKPRQEPRQMGLLPPE